MAWRDTGSLDPSLRGTMLVESVQEALLSIEAGNPGETEPLTPREGMLWADTDSGFEKQRNLENTDWITLWPIGSAPMAVVPRLITATGTDDEYTVDPFHETFILVDTTLGPVTLTLPDCTVATNKRLSIVKVGSSANAVTVDAFAGQSITGFVAEDLALRRNGEGVVLWNTPEYGESWHIEVDNTTPVHEHTLSGALSPIVELALVDTTAGIVTVTLPSPAVYRRRELVVKRTAGGNNAIVAPGGSFEIDNLGAGVAITLAAVNDRVRLRTDGTQWWRVD